MYFCDDLINVKNVDWLQGTVIKGGCQLLNLLLASSSSMPATIRLITKLVEWIKPFQNAYSIWSIQPILVVD